MFGLESHSAIPIKICIYLRDYNLEVVNLVLTNRTATTNFCKIVEIGSNTECNAAIRDSISTRVPLRSDSIVRMRKIVHITGMDHYKEPTNTYRHFHVAVCAKATGTPANAYR